MHLRGAAHAVGVLQAKVAGAVRFANRRALQQRPDVGGAGNLTRVGPERVQPGVAGGVGAAQRVGGQRGDQVGDLHQPPRLDHGERQERGHRLGAVDERQPLLGAELQRREPRPREALGGGQPPAVDAHLAVANQHGRQMGERRQIAARSHRAAARHQRQDVGAEQLEQRVDDLGPHARVAARQRVGAQQQHAAHGRIAERLADAGAVAQDQPALELLELIGGNAHAREIAEARVDTVHRCLAGERALDAPPASRDALAGSRREPAAAAPGDHGAKRRQRQRAAVELDHERAAGRG